MIYVHCSSSSFTLKKKMKMIVEEFWLFFNQFLNKTPWCKTKQNVFECTLYISTEGNFSLSKSNLFDKLDASNDNL